MELLDLAFANRVYGRVGSECQIRSTRGMEALVAAERAFTCGTGKYYVTECCGTFIVQKQGWFGRSFVGYARDVAEAIARIESDAHCWTVRAA